ncbi:MAG: transcription elongation factor GreA [Selenomonas sp.]|jgi:transcription elongation factor GreA|uniref:transcription elongation factor GreA n=1 Tax=Selenomonas sp. AE3005 TaxID=1485543 RepID=UPI000484F9F0|nr:transcription elongation factor GreA [Selenomonas sp. AE3005]MBQ1613234.1 transcription elongation factor GreA [Selenomonas sp.]MBQ1809421.1 transcription elongation factor GreA [Selenomonas sp.]MBQ1920713.1 transcription elongation factor GreA [Selenomonas sp.]MBQ2088346.1 transcription elongation factor GreA [Selenomonas sp.]MBQ4211748.1 transcription elongation factor GreA [Selenomonas sp.]
MADKKVMLTEDGYNKLVEKLNYLKSVRRIEVAERLKAAIALGDLSENSEYDDAKNEQAFLEGEIQDLEAKIRNSDIIKAGSGDVVQMGSRVSVVDLEFAEDGPETFMIVGSTEADPDEGKISNESPLGQALLGQKVGAVVDVHAPAGIIKYEIKEILS